MTTKWQRKLFLSDGEIIKFYLYIVVICRVYCADHTYTTLKTAADTTAGSLKVQAAEKLGMDKYSELILVELKSNGGELFLSLLMLSDAILNKLVKILRCCLLAVCLLTRKLVR